MTNDEAEASVRRRLRDGPRKFADVVQEVLRVHPTWTESDVRQAIWRLIDRKELTIDMRDTSIKVSARASDPKRNPDWERPSDWPFEEDWDSPAWKERMRQVDERRRQRLNEVGFVVCPRCKTQHTTKTLCCRECNYKPGER